MDVALNWLALAQRGIVVCCFAFAVTSAQAQVAQPQTFSELIIFGDSLSDTGNLALVNFPPPYFQNRISDGPLVVDRLASALGQSAAASEHLLGRESGLNFSVAGGNILGGDTEDLGSQISAYLSRANSNADRQAVYLLFAGGNDIRGLRNTLDRQVAQQQISIIVGALIAHIARLNDAGARFFIVPNGANIGRLPQTLEREAGSPGVSARLADYSRLYNQALSSALQNIVASRDIQLLSLDLFSEFETILDSPQQFGFTTAEEGCFDPDSGDIELECLLFGFDQRVFFDSLHPSSETNRLIADIFIPQVLAFQTEVFSKDKAVNIGGILLLLLDDS